MAVGAVQEAGLFCLWAGGAVEDSGADSVGGAGVLAVRLVGVDAAA